MLLFFSSFSSLHWLKVHCTTGHHTSSALPHIHRQTPEHVQIKPLFASKPEGEIATRKKKQNDPAETHSGHDVSGCVVGTQLRYSCRWVVALIWLAVGCPWRISANFVRFGCWRAIIVAQAIAPALHRARAASGFPGQVYKGEGCTHTHTGKDVQFR